LYGAIEAPFGQPRPMFIGHTLSSILGVAVTKLFLLLPPESFDNYIWLAGALSCAVASTVLAMLKLTHPPSGSTALIAATQADVRALGWYYVPVVMLSAVLMIALGLITNNLQRQYPMYWWTSSPLPSRKPEDIATPNLTDVASGQAAASVTTDLGDEEKGGETITVSLDGVVIPTFLRLNYDQRAMLDELQMKIKEFYSVTDE
jgi:CBS-domain-containing membrane protein